MLTNKVDKTQACTLKHYKSIMYKKWTDSIKLSTSFQQAVILVVSNSSMNELWTT
jgi:hypothetical protein